MENSNKSSGIRVSGFLGCLVCISLLFCFTVDRALGQATSTNSISGQVMDQQGATIPGTAIKLIDPSTKTTLTATANDAGRYIFLNIPSGKYAITFSKTGFNVQRVDAVEVEV